jgi:hypothetical protein
MSEVLSFLEVYNQTIKKFPTMHSLYVHTQQQSFDSEAYLLGMSVILFSKYRAIPDDQKHTPQAEEFLFMFYQHWNKLCEE